MQYGFKQLIIILKKDSLLKNDEQNFNVASKIKENLNVETSAAYFQIMGIFTNQNLKGFILSYIERCIVMVSKTKNFFELDFTFLSKILASSELHITSELQVHNAACNWLYFKYKKRLKFANSLIMKIRIHLLTDGVYKSLLDSPLLSLENENKLSLVKQNLKHRRHYHNRCSTTRHNSQEKYDFVILDSLIVNYKLFLSVQKTCGKNFQKKTQLTETTFNFRDLYSSVYVNGNLYVLGANKKYQSQFFVVKYSIETSTWIKVPGFKTSHLFGRLCVYINEIYFIGGSCSTNNYIYSSADCFSFDTNEKTYNFKVEKMKTPRNYFGCTVFQERIIASGGDDDQKCLKTVEAYDTGSNTWSDVQSMNEARVCHNLVAIKNKMFAVGGEGVANSCEVFDAFSDKYVVLKQPPNNIKLSLASSFERTAIAIGGNIYIFQEEDPSNVAAVYCLDKDEWFEQSLDLPEKNMGSYQNTFLKLPQI